LIRQLEEVMNRTALPVWIYFCLVIISQQAFSQPVPGEDTLYSGADVAGGKLNLFLIQPGGYIFFDMGEDVPPDADGQITRADFYKDGSALYNLQLLGVDLLWGRSSLRRGISLGLGVSVNSGDGNSLGSFVVASLGFALAYKNIVRFEVGGCLGISAKEALHKKTDPALYIGLAFPTNLGEALKKL
jgi:hypothetical protein